MALVALVLAREPEHEETAAHGFLGVPTIVWQTANLVLFLALLWVLLKKPAGKFFADRRRAVDEANRKAEADRARAEELAKEIDARLSGIEVEIERLKTHAVTEAAAEQKELLAAAEAEAQRIVARGTVDIDTRVRDARGQLTAFAADLAVQMAEDILARSVTPEDQARLLKEGTEAMARLVPAGGKGR